MEVLRIEWHDTGRERDIPAKVYLPQAKSETTTGASSAKVPVIIFSHGLGGTRDGYEYLGRHWASHGYASIHLQHVGSDDSVWKGKPRPLQAMRDAKANPRNAINRTKDVSFAIDQFSKPNDTKDDVWKGRLDLSKIGVAGHSFGAHTVLAVAGQNAGLLSAKDDRIKAGVALSAPVENGARGINFGEIRIPLFHFTGTKDEVPFLSSASPTERRIPFDRINGAQQFLLIFNGGDHRIFGGRNTEKNDEAMLRIIRAGTTAFWDGYLQGNPQSREWLSQGGGLKKALGDLGTLEEKPGTN